MRKTSWEERQKGLSYYDQSGTLPALKQEHPELKEVYAQVLQNVAERIDLAFKAFFRRVRKGEKPGYPRFRGRFRYDSFTYPQSGFSLCEQTVKLSKLGRIKAIIDLPPEGKIKRCTVKKTPTGKWFVSFSCECEKAYTPLADGEEVGIDLGLNAFATFSNGETIENPRFFRGEEKNLAKAQRKHAKQEKGTPQREKTRRVVARVHERIRWKRKDFTHQHSRKVVDKYGTIVVEDLNVNRMVHNRCLAKSISDAAWTQFTSLLSYKAEWAGRVFLKVNPAYTSQDCSNCGHRKKLSLSERTYSCACCGLVMDRDRNAAKNILALGRQCLAQA